MESQPSITPFIPYDALECIFEHVKNHQDLTRCCLTSKALLSVARVRLYETVRIQALEYHIEETRGHERIETMWYGLQPKTTTLLSILRQNSYLRSLVRDVDLTYEAFPGDEEMPPTSLLDPKPTEFLHELLQLFTSAKHFHLGLPRFYQAEMDETIERHQLWFYGDGIEASGILAHPTHPYLLSSYNHNNPSDTSTSTSTKIWISAESAAQVLPPLFSLGTLVLADQVGSFATVHLIESEQLGNTLPPRLVNLSIEHINKDTSGVMCLSLLQTLPATSDLRMVNFTCVWKDGHPEGNEATELMDRFAERGIKLSFGECCSNLLCASYFYARDRRKEAPLGIELGTSSSLTASSSTLRPLERLLPLTEVIIIGSGIMGLCSAFYTLSRGSPSTKVTILESSTERTVAGGASSYAGGFIGGGPSWHDPSSQDLARESWKCHVELAELLDGAQNFGWRECGAVGLSVGHPVHRSAYRTLPGGKGKENIEVNQGKLPPGVWVEGEAEELSLEGGVGQVDPLEFCQTLFRYLSTTFPDRFSIRFGRATSLRRPPTQSGSTPTVDSRSSITFSPHPSGDFPSPSAIDISFDKLVIAAGPWSAHVCEQLNLPQIPITCLPGHSLLIRPCLDSFVPSESTNRAKELPSEAVFAGIDGAASGVHGESFGLARGLSEDEKRRGYTRAPEFFVRKNGQVYIAGENSIPDSAPSSKVGLPNKLPETVDEVKGMIDDECVGRLKRAAGAVSPFLKEENGAVIERTQFCYRPISSDREPIVGFLEKNVLLMLSFLQGITLGPGSGKVIAEMLLDRKSSADVSDLSPRRFGIEV
ncbi:NAD(P)/FAD-dependent oxidoreductase [Sporobolomyces salmoneus]|uniref:NAD(P)/FAD-dependent oxidoreductase n=1 Tax=Sporobolomyces salmoneus TaxID=183962 RepID=UPI003175B5EF